jgi:predicted RND superfamily exporter protein
VSARARTDDLENKAVKRLRELVLQTESEVPGVNAAITGEAVLEYDEMKQSQSDTTLATVVSLVLVALIFIYGYSESGRPLKATACLIVGLGFTMGFATLAVGHLNILTITFVPMLIGLAIDFGVHLITRYEEELRHGRSEQEALEKAIVNTGLGIYTGAFTTAGAFLAMGLTDFKGIREMGIISGGGLLICLVPMMTLLPIWLLRGRQNILDHQGPQKPDTRARIERLWLDRPRTVLALTAVLCALAAVKAWNVPFDYNLLNLQTRGLPAVVFEHKLIEAAEKSVLFGAVVTDSLEAAGAVETRITNLPAVASVDSMTRFLTEDQSTKLGLIREIKQELAAIEFARPEPRPVNI